MSRENTRTNLGECPSVLMLGTGGTSPSRCTLLSAALAAAGDTELDLRLRPKNEILCFPFDCGSRLASGSEGTGKLDSGCRCSARPPRRNSERSDVLERRRLVDVLAGADIASWRPG